MDEENYIKRQQQLQLPNTSSTVYNKFYVNLQNTVLVDDPTIAWVSPALIPIKN